MPGRIVRWISREEINWDEVYAEQLPRVFNFFRYRCGNVADAEDLTSITFEKAWRGRDRYRRDKGAFSTWLYTIARNTCLTAVRAQSYRKTAVLDPSSEPSVSSTTPLSIELDQYLSRLPEVQREVITLFYLEERSVEDVAQLLDLPEGTVKSHLHRARRALAEMMEQ